MAYAVKEVYLTLQGEGGHAGRAAVFCRFAGCNLWSGREEDRSTAACRFCDTDFVGTNGPGGGKFRDAAELAHHLRRCWDEECSGGVPYVVFTGGEPTLQLDKKLVDACHAAGIEVGLETNGTGKVPAGVDWICVSPKPRSEIVQTEGHELKLVYPQPELSPTDFEHLDFEHFFLQPMDAKGRTAANIEAATRYCLANPKWRLSLQTHKLIGIP
ncbi:MAG: 7-carboxy-7-deazaguanine synthase [Deltaproteobacteria bacterium]|nr:MAG: 7-carboxy-7-deazaguanine synthase [Deltaproteobacteria bacterium]